MRAVYLFGSVLHSESPADLDLVVVYEPPLAPLSAPSVTPLIEEAVKKTFGLPTHLMFFSTDEANQPGLLASLNPRALYERDA